MTNRSDSIVLIGPMGAGKTSIGKRVARALNVRFVDTDAVVVREHGAIAELFAERGEAHFRSLERVAVRDALVDGGVVALGGGAVLDEATQRELSEHRVVFLTVAPRVVATRVSGSKRPLLQGDDAAQRWTEIFETRRPIYETLADVTFDTSSGPLADIVAEIVAWSRKNETPEEK
ncbi:shikimate kinase [Microbacterium sp. NPDC076911]|uniref:shikimate kinase n=1 Tax=Microbacterium sp. NPDC076911 TaxID=3154958 RepID=UPI003441B185